MSNYRTDERRSQKQNVSFLSHMPFPSAWLCTPQCLAGWSVVRPFGSFGSFLSSSSDHSQILLPGRGSLTRLAMSLASLFPRLAKAAARSRTEEILVAVKFLLAMGSHQASNRKMNGSWVQVGIDRWNPVWDPSARNQS